jgi:ATP-binding cassette subfamily C (CFTR/MRP) protein 1
MTIIDTELPYSLIDLSLSVMTTIMGAILMCLSAGYFAAMMPPVMLGVWGKSSTVQLRLLLTLILVLQKYYLRTSRQMRLLDLEAKSPLYSHFLESLTGLVEIRAFGWSDSFLVSRSAV